MKQEPKPLVERTVALVRSQVDQALNPKSLSDTMPSILITSTHSLHPRLECLFLIGFDLIDESQV